MRHDSSKYLMRIEENSSSIRDLQPFEKARSSKTHRERQYFDKTFSILLQSSLNYPIFARKLVLSNQEIYISLRKVNQHKKVH